jgi:hypothetical protein
MLYPAELRAHRYWIVAVAGVFWNASKSRGYVAPKISAQIVDRLLLFFGSFENSRRVLFFVEHLCSSARQLDPCLRAYSESPTKMRGEGVRRSGWLGTASSVGDRQTERGENPQVGVMSFSGDLSRNI